TAVAGAHPALRGQPDAERRGGVPRPRPPRARPHRGDRVRARGHRPRAGRPAGRALPRCGGRGPIAFGGVEARTSAQRYALLAGTVLTVAGIVGFFYSSSFGSP